MSYTLRLITAPTIEPVSLTEVKAHLVIEHDDDDALLTGLIVAARRHVEARTNTVLVRQQWRQTLDCFGSGNIQLNKTPAQEIEQIQYVDADGATQSVDTADYSLDRPGARVLLGYGASWPDARYQTGAVWVDFWCGHYDPASSPVNPLSDVPEDIRIAILLMVEHMHEHRGAMSEIQLFTNPTFGLLLQPYWMPV